MTNRINARQCFSNGNKRSADRQRFLARTNRKAPTGGMNLRHFAGSGGCPTAAPPTDPNTPVDDIPCLVSLLLLLSSPLRDSRSLITILLPLQFFPATPLPFRCFLLHFLRVSSVFKFKVSICPIPAPSQLRLHQFPSVCAPR